MLNLVITCLLLFKATLMFGQYDDATRWSKDGYSYYSVEKYEIYTTNARNSESSKVLSAAMLTPKGQQPLQVRRFTLSADGSKFLINTNTQKVWRYDTRGDYWVYNTANNSLVQIGKHLPASSLMFAKFSPDAKRVGFVSGHNIYVEDLATQKVKQLTFNGTTKLINGTFDWAYEEEFDCRDGFRWSPDGQSIAFWQIDASTIKNYLMLNTTDSVYPYVVPVEYPVAGEDPSSCKVGVVNVTDGNTCWLKVPGDAIQHYIPRMEWCPNSKQIILQQLNRAQTESKLFVCDALSGTARLIHEEHDDAWIDTKSNWDHGEWPGWDWLSNGKSFIWESEKDGWEHLYEIGLDGSERLITKGNYDVISTSLIDEASGYIYFAASPDDPLRKYLYRIKLSGGLAERLTPADEPGTNEYELSPNGKIGLHTFSNVYTEPKMEMISLPDHRHLYGDEIKIDPKNKPAGAPQFFRVITADSVAIDGWMKKPTNFDPTKKYPIVFYVYGEPAAPTVQDVYKTGHNRLYKGDMAQDGYIYVSVDNRGAPLPRGRAWRKAIYRNIGTLNIRDQAMAAKEILKWPFVDTSRVAVWGWSGGGSSTLNLMFQYPQIYKTGIAIAAVDYQLTYDNIYQERYMGVPVDEEGRSYFIKGSPVSYAKNLQGNLLYIHGTGDDNVHYKNAEMLINELVKYNKQFQLMLYPNRTHGISEGEGTKEHLSTLYTNYLKQYCPPGGR